MFFFSVLFFSPYSFHVYENEGLVAPRLETRRGTIYLELHVLLEVGSTRRSLVTNAVFHVAGHWWLRVSIRSALKYLLFALHTSSTVWTVHVWVCWLAMRL